VVVFCLLFGLFAWGALNFYKKGKAILLGWTILWLAAVVAIHWWLNNATFIVGFRSTTIATRLYLIVTDIPMLVLAIPAILALAFIVSRWNPAENHELTPRQYFVVYLAAVLVPVILIMVPFVQEYSATKVEQSKQAVVTQTLDSSDAITLSKKLIFDLSHATVGGSEMASPSGKRTASVQANSGSNYEQVNFTVADPAANTKQSYSFTGAALQGDYGSVGDKTAVAWADENTLLVYQEYLPIIKYPPYVENSGFAIWKYDIAAKQATLLKTFDQPIDFTSVVIGRKTGTLYYIKHAVINTETTHLVALTIASGEEKTVANAPDLDKGWPTWSHDGERVVYFNNDKSTLEIYEPASGKIISLGHYDLLGAYAPGEWMPGDALIFAYPKFYKTSDGSAVDIQDKLDKIGYAGGVIFPYDKDNLIVPINNGDTDPNGTFALFNVNDYSIKKVVFQ